ncbi:hypothetical protein [Nonomuraea sp. NPDC050783]|uniref:hypothetical protein n=1 Tax=Nonomuraea sp. NPDC050783 TaxID=3154634 RepID=UPI003465868B
MDLDRVADRLYGLTPPEFTAARAAEARAARDAGDVRLSREIAKLRRPTVSAWAVNRAAREHPAEVAELLEVGERLRAAWPERDPGTLAELARRRGEAAGRLLRLIRQESALSAAAAAEVEQTLDAAVVDAGAAGQVRRGRLARPLAYSGFAPAPVPRVGPAAGKQGGAAAGKQGGPAAGKRGGAAGKRGAGEDEAAAARAREEAAARKARERAEAEAAHREWREALEAAQRDFDERAAEAERLERALAEARDRLGDSRSRLEVTRREERRARRRLERL